MKTNKYSYSRVIQQYYGQGWEDVSAYETGSDYISTEGSGVLRTNSKGRTFEPSLLNHDLKEYRLTGYPTRVVSRRELNPVKN
jgi:hypothetical protein